MTVVTMHRMTTSSFLFSAPSGRIIFTPIFADGKLRLIFTNRLQRSCQNRDVSPGFLRDFRGLLSLLRENKETYSILKKPLCHFAEGVWLLK